MKKDDEILPRKGQFLRFLAAIGVSDVLVVVSVGGSGDRAGEADSAGLLRREGEVSDGSGGRRHSPARQGADRRGFRLRPRSPGQELHSQSGLNLCLFLLWLILTEFGEKFLFLCA